MTTYDLGGWAYITNGTDIIWFGAENWKKDCKPESIEGEHLPGDGHYGYDLGARKRLIKFYNVLFSSKADKERLEYDLQSWNTSGTFTLKIKVDSTPAYEKLKASGTTTELDVLYVDMKGVEKIGRGDIHFYKIATVIFEQFG